MEKLEVANTLAQHFARITKLAINWIGWNCQSLTLEAAEKKPFLGSKKNAIDGKIELEHEIKSRRMKYDRLWKNCLKRSHEIKEKLLFFLQVKMQFLTFHPKV